MAGWLLCQSYCLASDCPAQEERLHEIIISYSDQNKRLQLYRVNEDGSSRRQITDGEANCVMPAWSPDGENIVYVQQSQSGMDLWLCDPDGRHTKALTKTGRNIIPSWLPDSKHIVWTVFTRGKDPAADSRIHIMNTETLESRRLFTDPEQTRFSNSMPVVSPDGKLVAFVSDRIGPFRIWVSNLDGSEARPVSTPAREFHPRLKLPFEQKVPCWSPDGNWIAHWEGVEMNHLSKFTGIRSRERDELISGSWNVWIVGKDGKGKRRIGCGDDPTWSPDGHVTRAFPDRQKGGPKIMIERTSETVELPVIPDKTAGYGRLTWKP